MQVEFLLEPFRVIWEIFPPVLAVPLIAYMVIWGVRFAQKFHADLEESVEAQPIAGYDPEHGYRFDPDDFE